MSRAWSRHVSTFCHSVCPQGLSYLGMGQYARPLQANFKAVDSVLLLPSATLLFQYTVSSRHPITSEGLADVLLHLPEAASHRVALVYVVPEGAPGTANLLTFGMSTRDWEAVQAALKPRPAKGRKPATRAPDVELSICVMGLPVDKPRPVVGA